VLSRQDGRGSLFLPSPSTLATELGKSDHPRVLESCDTRRFSVPRGKALFAAGGSPNSDLWPSQPVEALKEIAARHDVEYIEGSLIFAPGGRVAEALFETFEPGGERSPSQLFRLAEDLDAWEFRLFVDPDRWRDRQAVGAL
jgi:hypothetical protein